MPAPREVQRTTTRLLSAAMIVIGVVLLARTLSSGGGPFAVGVIMGVVLIVAGVARLCLERGER